LERERELKTEMRDTVLRIITLLLLSRSKNWMTFNENEKYHCKEKDEEK